MGYLNRHQLKFLSFLCSLDRLTDCALFVFCFFLQQPIMTVADVINNFLLFNGADDLHSSSRPLSRVTLPLLSHFS